MDAPEKATFSIERNGLEYDVDVSRSVIATATSSDHLTSETMAGWLQNNLDKLSDVAGRKIDAQRPADRRVAITADDL